MAGEADLGIEAGRGRRRQENERAPWAKLLPGLSDQFTPDTRMLNTLVHGKVRQIATVTEVGDRSGNANEQILLPGSYNKIGVAKHSLYAMLIFDRSSFGERRPAENVNKLVDRNGLANPVIGQGTSLEARLTAASQSVGSMGLQDDSNSARPRMTMISRPSCA